METYWDLTNKERANLSDERMNQLQQYELMTGGASVAVKPELQEVPEKPEVPTVKYYQIKGDRYSSLGDLIFENIEDANLILTMKIKEKKYNYDTKITTAEPVKELSIEAIDVSDSGAINHLKEELQKIANIRNSNAVLQNEYDKAISSRTKVLESLNEDYREHVDTKAQIARLIKTYEEYKKVADDDLIAMKFLLKGYKEEPEVIEYAILWEELDEEMVKVLREEEAVIAASE